ncbi:hypothetical protein E2C01_014850 [Portunus trituberculatus]|uniref:Uncharacterized protein n=1 Tax=Portunus trituberculatus TaxID=210409 RepID=A0A5B7DK98_PORTR|nr:hypothetical protein [Portunus trituberculatus]
MKEIPSKKFSRLNIKITAVVDDHSSPKSIKMVSYHPHFSYPLLMASSKPLALSTPALMIPHFTFSCLLRDDQLFRKSRNYAENPQNA